MMLFGSMQRSLAPARKERWEREKEKKDFHLEGAETLPDWSSLKKKMVAFFSSPFYVFLSFRFPMEGDFMMAVARGRTTKKKREGLRTHRERKKKKEAHQKQQAAESRCAVVAKRPRGRTEKVAQPPFWAWPRYDSFFPVFISRDTQNPPFFLFHYSKFACVIHLDFCINPRDMRV